MLDTLIIFSISPIGFMMVMITILFFGYLITKSIIKDAGIVNTVLKKKHKDTKEVLDPIAVATVRYIKNSEWFH